MSSNGQWRIPVNGDWFYGTKEACERERAEFESTFTELDHEEAGVVLPEEIYSDSPSELAKLRATNAGLLTALKAITNSGPDAIPIKEAFEMAHRAIERALTP